MDLYIYHVGLCNAARYKEIPGAACQRVYCSTFKGYPQINQPSDCPGHCSPAFCGLQVLPYMAADKVRLLNPHTRAHVATMSPTDRSCHYRRGDGQVSACLKLHCPPRSPQVDKEGPAAWSEEHTFLAIHGGPRASAPIAGNLAHPLVSFVGLARLQRRGQLLAASTSLAGGPWTHKVGQGLCVQVRFPPRQSTLETQT
jgi:hypothetical protein